MKDRCGSARAKRPSVVVLGGVRPGLQAGLNAFSEGILEGIRSGAASDCHAGYSSSQRMRHDLWDLLLSHLGSWVQAVLVPVL